MLKSISGFSESLKGYWKIVNRVQLELISKNREVGNSEIRFR